MRRWISAVGLGLVLALAGGAGAEAKWLKVQTDHFVFYGDQSEAEMRRAATELENFRFSLTSLLKTKDTPGEPRLDVYLVSRRADLLEVDPDLDRAVAGFYRRGPGGVSAYASWEPALRETSRHILQHEYVHHFIARHFTTAFPPWFVEGVAEYFAATSFEDGMIDVGNLPEARRGSLRLGRWLPVSRLVKTGQPDPRDTEMLYAEGWLLTHYLLRDPARAQQLRAYFAALGKHEAEPDAFKAAFGVTHDEMDSRLKTYAEKGLGFSRISTGALPAPKITVEALPASADDLMLISRHLMNGRRGETDAEARKALDEVRTLAAKYPGDAFARRTLAHAEQVFGDPREAVRIISETPGLEQDWYAQYIAAVSHRAIARRTPAEAQTRQAGAKAAFAAAVKLDRTAFPALYGYAGMLDPASEAAADALVQAHLLAPEVDEIRINAAIALMRQKAFDLALGLLEPLASDPHNRRSAATAQVLAELAERKQAPPSDRELTQEINKRLAAAG